MKQKIRSQNDLLTKQVCNLVPALKDINEFAYLIDNPNNL